MIRTRWAVKPRSGVAVDRSSPIGGRLMAAWLFDQGCPPIDAVRGVVGTFSAAGADWAGEDLILNGSQYGNLLGSSDTRRNIGAAQSFTLAFGARLTPTSGGNYSCIVGTALNGLTQGWGLLQAPSGDGSKVYFQFVDGTNDVNSYGSPGFAADSTFHHFAVVLDRRSSTLRLAVDGAQVASVSSASLGSITPPGGAFAGFRDTPIATRLRYAYLIDDALPAAQLRSIQADPYQVFARPRAPLYAATATATSAAPPWFLQSDLSGGLLTMGM